MTVESVTYIDDLNPAYPETGTAIRDGDDHLRNIKLGITQTLPNITGPILPTQAELNYMSGVTSAVQTQLNTKITSAGVTFENLNDNGDVGTGATQVATGNHTHVMADVTDLSSQTHTLSDITDYVREYILIQDQQTSGTSGGTNVAATWTARVLNTEVTDTGSNASLASNQITLDAGTYELEATAPFFRTNRVKLRWANITDTTYVYGKSDFASVPGEASTLAQINCRFTIASSKVFELQYYAQAAYGTYGLGVETSDGTDEIYAEVKLIKVA